ncbi:MAG: hypothetical protein SWQ30_06875 [Thermodesulfobacteriota bacterium]|nr:hypothetical protein [Thermodesulfobacteriota bacterium]
MLHMPVDIRDEPYIGHSDILGLNFIRDPGVYRYRRHYRQGLRSHVMEILSPQAVKNETRGVMVDGSRRYPRAEPFKMLRLFRARFKSLKDAKAELTRVKLITAYLAPDHLGRPEEFLVEYSPSGKGEILLCGLQEYVRGQILDPWSLLNKDHLVSILNDMGCDGAGKAGREGDQWAHLVREEAASLVQKLKQMITEVHHVPDLAGIGNLIVTPKGGIKLVDINNISKVSFDSIVNLDDRGYPVCDKSIEALSHLEKKLVDRHAPEHDPIYKVFLDPERMKDVRAAEKAFYLSMETRE